ncbi:apolipoprotein C-II [Sorex araneus]|uniref:apolipoprotein C-II n=1 Tax=Sorex araneus TaxID=42254 RepID=UPI0003315597|nr:apolipoprotein C-II [Sorex araneus]
MDRRLLALTLVLLILGCEAQVLPQEDEALLPKFQTSLFGYWDSAKTAAQGLYEKATLTNVDEKLRDIYSQSTAAVATYAAIFTDQLYSLIRGDP